MLAVSCTVIALLLRFCPVAAIVNNRREILDARWKLQAKEIKANKLMSAGSNYTAKIDPQKSFGTWTGWGTSLAWWAAAFGKRDDLADAIFSMNDLVDVSTTEGSVTLPGLGLTIARYNIGASSHTPAGGDHMVVSPRMNPQRAMQALFLTWENNNTYDWSRDENQRAMLHKAQTRGADTFQLFANSPVWFHLDNHNPSGANFGWNDNLQSWNHRQFAQMMAEVAAHFDSEWGLSFQSVEPFNEPSSDWWNSDGDQEGCHFSWPTQISVIKELREQLDAYGLKNMHIAASDENEYDEATSTWNAFGDDTRALVDQIDTHGYQYGGGRRDLLYNAAHADKKILWNSEYGEGDASGAQLATNLNLDIYWLHNTAWVYWQVLDGGGWGLMAADLANQNVTQINRKYFVLAQFSRHIRPGSTILSSSDVNTVASYLNHSLTLVTTNTGGDNFVTYDLSAFKYSGGSPSPPPSPSPSPLPSPPSSPSLEVLAWRTDFNGDGDTYTLLYDGWSWGNDHHTLTMFLKSGSVVTLEINGIEYP